ncbi:MAG: cellulase family glycosylhydrolase [Oscillospiraceae bacterium]|nr:cellulase family glycosylhydrolase [Oscillospiraceae bacterium]
MLCTGCSKETADETAKEVQAAANAVTEAVTESEGNNLTSLEVISLMGNGINLGNTLEAYNHQGYVGGLDPTTFETSWGQPKTTPEIIQGMKDAGFDTLRIPVAWTNGMNFESGDYTIDERLMNRVEEVVNYALDADMYVIINDHWDGGWWGMFGSADMEVREKGMELYKSMWSQIGERFRNYSYKLIFESANEELGDRLNDKEITGSKGVLNQNECYEKLYEINSEFVKLIRSTGGKNADRFLLIAGYNTDITMTCDERYKMPEDTAKDKLLLSVHYYTPWDYCGTEAINHWGSPDDFEEQNTLLEMLSKFNEQGYGVVIGEYAVQTTGATKPDTDKFYNNFLDNCDYYEFCPVLWDCSTLYKRHSLKMSDENLAEIFDTRRLANEKGKTSEEIKLSAKERIEAAYKKAEDEMMAEIEILPSDDKAAAWIMFQSADWNVAYSVGDGYDPTNMTIGIKASNVEVTGEGTYTVGLDFTELGGVYGTAFSALGIYNGETLFPGYTADITSIEINGEPYETAGDEYTTSDDGKCTRVNLYNQWVTKVPEDARTADGNISNCSAQIMPLGNSDKINTLTVTFTYIAP